MDPGEVKWVNFHSPPPPFLSPLLFFSYPLNIDAQTSNTSTRPWFYYIITKIHPPFQNPASAPGRFYLLLVEKIRRFLTDEK